MRRSIRADNCTGKFDLWTGLAKRRKWSKKESWPFFGEGKLKLRIVGVNAQLEGGGAVEEEGKCLSFSIFQVHIHSWTQKPRLLLCLRSSLNWFFCTQESKEDGNSCQWNYVQRISEDMPYTCDAGRRKSKTSFQSDSKCSDWYDHL